MIFYFSTDFKPFFPGIEKGVGRMSMNPWIRPNGLKYGGGFFLKPWQTARSYWFGFLVALPHDAQSPAKILSSLPLVIRAAGGLVSVGIDGKPPVCRAAIRSILSGTSSWSRRYKEARCMSIVIGNLIIPRLVG
jgi:hypothetical protein